MPSTGTRYSRSAPTTTREAHTVGPDSVLAPRIPIEPGIPRIGRLASGPPFHTSGPGSATGTGRVVADGGVHATGCATDTLGYAIRSRQVKYCIFIRLV